ncbi:MAG: response regulator [Chlorobiaceae bacterium]|nr:response regulator [Chlorobiaceae bacterium]
MKKILVVDDNLENVFLLQNRLEKDGFDVITAYDGRVGLEKIRSEKPDLVLLDIMMPELSGLDVCKEVANDHSISDIPIILLSAKVTAEETEEGLKAGAIDYIKKPFNKIELLARINSAIKFREAKQLLIEAEKIDTFAATVVTANHKIKQPLTIIKLSLTGINRLLNKDDISRNEIKSKLTYIETAVNDIVKILDQLNSIEIPKTSEYLGKIRMIDIDSIQQQTNKKIFK